MTIARGLTVPGFPPQVAARAVVDVDFDVDLHLHGTAVRRSRIFDARAAARLEAEGFAASSTRLPRWKTSHSSGSETAPARSAGCGRSPVEMTPIRRAPSPPAATTAPPPRNQDNGPFDVFLVVGACPRRRRRAAPRRPPPVGNEWCRATAVTLPQTALHGAQRARCRSDSRSRVPRDGIPRRDCRRAELQALVDAIDRGNEPGLRKCARC